MGEPRLGNGESSPETSLSFRPRRAGLYLLLIVLVSFFFRWNLIRQKEVVGTDEVIYLALGKNLWHGQGFRLLGHPVTMCPPLLPLVAGVFSLFTEDLEMGTNFTYVVFGGLLVLPGFYFARRVVGERAARLAAFFLAFYPGLLLSFYWGSMTEPLYTFVLVTSFLFFHRALQANRPLDFALAGVFLAFVYLTRSEGILFFPVLGVYGAFTLARTGPSFRRSTGNLLLFVLCFALVSAPYPLFLKRHSGGLSVSGKTKLILLAGAMDLRERERLLGKLTEDGADLFDYESLVKDQTVTGMVLENPKVLLGGSLLQVRNFFSTLFSWKVFPAFLLGFVILGLFRDPWDRERARQEAFLVVTCLPFLVFLTFHIWPRYLLPMTPVLLLWAVRGIVSLEDWIQQTAERIREGKGPSRRWVLLLPRVCVAVPLLAILIAKPIKAKMLVQYPIEYKTAGHWMAENLPQDAEILARKPEIAYYARRMMRLLPNEDLPRVLQYARTQGVDYLVVDEYFIATRPQLEFLLRTPEVPEALELLHEERGPSGRLIRVFRILGTAPGSPSSEG